MNNESNRWRTQYPLLQQFFRGYLHQEFPEEYGSVAGALRQYRKDAGEEEFADFASEWKRFVTETGDLGPGEIDRILSSELGGSWHVASSREITRFTEAVERTGAQRAS